MATIDKIRLSGTTYDIVDSSAVHSLDGYWTSGQTNAAITAATEAIGEQLANKADTSAVTASINAATSGKTNQSDFTAHTSNTTVHITAAERTAWNAKADASAITEFFDGAVYDSNTKRINFKHGNTVKAYIDATDFVKDGMVSNVEIKTISSGGTQVEVLAITFNSDSGKEEIDIPIADIFDASNYYTKTDTDNKISQATSGKADSSDVYTKTQTDNKIDTELSAFTYDKETIDAKVASGGTFDPTNYYTKSDTDTLLSGKQATLVNQTNIKSVGGETLLGSGNVKTLHANLDGTTLVFTES